MPYAFEDFDTEDIKKRLDLFVPENMYCFFHSKLLNEEKQENPGSFIKERFYNREFAI